MMIEHHEQLRPKDIAEIRRMLYIMDLLQSYWDEGWAFLPPTQQAMITHAHWELSGITTLISGTEWEMVSDLTIRA